MTALVLFISPACPTNALPLGQPPAADKSTFAFEMKCSLAQMEKDMLAGPMTGDPDHDFMSMMLPHHYIGRSPHEAFFTPDGKELWATVRGEHYVSVIDPIKELTKLTAREFCELDIT